MSWIGLGLPIHLSTSSVLTGGGGSGAVNSAPVIPNITLQFDIVAA